MSIVLLCGALYGILRAAMLCPVPVNRAANRLLAVLIVVLALYTAPYVIGYAGYYDAYPWLSFAPYNLSLAIGPLLYLYVACMLAGGAHLPRRWALHLLPALLQLLYYGAVFVQPLDFKNDWDGRIHLAYVDPVETVALLASTATYWTLALRRYQRARTGPLEWTRNLLVASGLAVAAWWVLAGAELASGGLSYFQRFPFYLWLALLAGYLGTEGYRQGTRAWPLPAPAPAPAFAQATAPAPAPTAAELGARWRDSIVEQAWWRDPELSLPELARRLGTNTTAPSRALNEGLGMNFNEVLNQLRVEAVLAALRRPDEDRPVLDIALSEGFNSKASFNRVFKQLTGETPSTARRRLQSRVPTSSASQLP